MKIIAIEYEPSSKRGGQERSYFDILTRLQAKGHQVTLAYVVEGDLIEKYRFAGVKTVQIPRINLFKKTSIRQWLEFMKSFRLIRDVKDSVIYINQIQDLPLAALLKKYKKARRLVCHLRLPPLYGNLQTSRNQISLLAKNIDSYIVANENMRIAHVQNGVPEPKIQVIPNGFDFSDHYNQKPIEDGRLRLVYLGRIEDSKGILELIEAMPKIVAQFPQVSLSIAGAPMNEGHAAYLEVCKVSVKRLDLDSYIKFVGRVDNPIEFLRDFDVTLFPSIWNEPFGRVLVESIIAGVPVIARRIGATAEILDDSNFEWVFTTDDDLVRILTKIKEYPFDKIYSYQQEKYNITASVAAIEKVIGS